MIGNVFKKLRQICTVSLDKRHLTLGARGKIVEIDECLYAKVKHWKVLHEIARLYSPGNDIKNVELECNQVNGDMDIEDDEDNVCLKDDDVDDRLSDNGSDSSIGSSIFGSLKGSFEDRDDDFDKYDDNPTLAKTLYSKTDTLTDKDRSDDDETQADLNASTSSEGHLVESEDEISDVQKSVKSTAEEKVREIDSKLKSFTQPTVPVETELQIGRALSKHENPMPCQQ
ncbi:hypothetical protein BpHYR1_040489, partial [Brachionus plicatilis]